MIKPVNDCLLVEILLQGSREHSLKHVTGKSGIVRQEKKPWFSVGRVMEVSDGHTVNGKLHKLQVIKGDVIMFDCMDGTKVISEGPGIVTLRDSEIIAVIEDFDEGLFF